MFLFFLYVKDLFRSLISEAVREGFRAHSQMLNGAETIIPTKEAANFLGVSVSTIYRHSRKIPHMKRFGKLYFKQSDLINFLEAGKLKFN